MNEWTSRDIELLRQYHARGLPYPEIAARLNRSRGSVGKKCHRLGLKAVKVIKEKASITKEKKPMSRKPWREEA